MDQQDTPSSVLMARFRESLDTKAFEEIFSRFTSPAMGVARQMLLDGSLTEDAVQETFLRIVRRRETYRPVMSFDNWFYAILRNVCRDLLRRRTRHAKAIVQLGPQRPDRVTSCDHSAADAGDLLSKLPHDARIVLSLRIVEGMSFAEIAAAVGISVEAAKKRAQRALRRLRELYRSVEEPAEVLSVSGRDRSSRPVFSAPS